MAAAAERDVRKTVKVDREPTATPSEVHPGSGLVCGGTRVVGAHHSHVVATQSQPSRNLLDVSSKPPPSGCPVAAPVLRKVTRTLAQPPPEMSMPADLANDWHSFIGSPGCSSAVSPRAASSVGSAVMVSSAGTLFHCGSK